MDDAWDETTSIGTLRSDDLAQAGNAFRYNHFVYRTNGAHLANGGMGTVYELERRDDDTGIVEKVVGKVFHSNYLYQLRTDEVTRRDHHHNLAAMARIAAIEHPNILPTYVSAPIADNYLFVTPRMGMTLLEAIGKHNLTPRARTKLLVQALEGLGTLHAARLIHRDFTLRNILVDDGANVAYLFDFDLAMSLDDIGNQTFRNYYKGRIFGSPGWSVAPETIDQALMDSNINTSLDVYAIGGALHGLFTEQLLYGPADDMWALLIRIAEGVVVGGRSKVYYPENFPTLLRGVIEGCLERDPAQRFPSVQAVVTELRGLLRELPDETKRESKRRLQTSADEDKERAVSKVMESTRCDPAGRVRDLGVELLRREGARPRARSSDLPREPACGSDPGRSVPGCEHVSEARHGDRSDEDQRPARLRRELAALLLADLEARAPRLADVAAQSHLRREQ
jgi:serine/threonine protein kinase